MERQGFVHDALDIKVLVLYVSARVQKPVNIRDLFALCYQDDCIDYFEFCSVVPQMAENGYLKALPEDYYEITDLGRETEQIMGETVPYPVAQRAAEAAENYNRNLRRSALIQTETSSLPNGDAAVTMSLSDGSGKLMSLELFAPSVREGRKLEKIFKANAEHIYSAVMEEFLKRTPKNE